MAGLEHYFRELVEGMRSGIIAAALQAVLRLLAFPYALILILRARAYRAGLFGSHRLPRPVIAVGNITVGGTGKTPTVAFLARHLMERGKRVVVISRGYGGTMEGEVRIVSDGARLLLTPKEAGDEPCLLAESVPGLMVVIGADRYRAGLHAMETLSPDIFILDDGYQHLRIERDLNILLLDCSRPFGNGHTLPAGLLREPVSAAGRADLVIFTRCNDRRPEGLDLLRGKPFCTSSHRLTGLMPLGGDTPLPFTALANFRGVAFAGIADPGAFFDALGDAGLNLHATLAFPDHSAYGIEELTALASLKRSVQPDYLVTTAKDAVKLKSCRDVLGKCYAAQMELQVADPGLLHAAVEKLL